MKKSLLIVLLMAGLGLSGCATMAPDYIRPEAPVPKDWPEGEAYQAGIDHKVDESLADLPWRSFFTDADLRTLIERALENNRDLRVAALNIERARAQYRIQRADLFPFVDAGGGYSRQRDPDILYGMARTWEQYDVNLGVSAWEVDFFGRVRSLKDQALEAYLATEEARRAAQVSLVSEVARSYLTLAADHELLALAKETLQSHRSTYDLTRRRFEAGVASELEVQQARTTVEAARVQIARYTSMVAEGENALRLLIGASLSPELLPGELGESVEARMVSAGVPSQVLLSRPDILAAEHRLKAANANIGAARASFFPRISLTATAGLASAELSDLFDSDSRTWVFSPGVTLPIFNAGSLRARLETSKVDREMMLARYEGAIQTAFREVSDTLAQRGTIDEQIDAQRALVEATAASYELSEARFSKGIDSFLNVLDSQRSLFSAQQNLISARLARETNLVTLYRVLGGGAY
ncbi:MAG: efflux transporter outer membrane subunit [Thermodesulfobacteriota bacterium]|jgi:multidrug efflux system outer membrane protein|nr:efflux transporter outer membrane subunit [Thermodesulfobacteriota bacterium]